MRNNTRMGCAVALVAGVVTLSAQTPVTDPLRAVAERYVKLVLAVGQHDADYVDAFYGPAEWRKEAEAAKTPLATIDSQAAALEADLTTTGVHSRRRQADARAELWGLRRQYLARQLASMRARISMLQGKKLTFDEESLALYDAVAPVKPESEFEAVLKQLDARLPGEGSLIDRYDRYKQAFVIPKRARRSRVPGGDPRLPAADEFRRICRRRNVQGRVRHRQIVEWLQLVSGQLQEPDPGEHRSADLHRSRHRPGVS